MKTFIEYIKEEGIINSLIEFYKLKNFNKKEKELLNLVLDKLRIVNNLNENNALNHILNIDDMSFEFLRKIYEKILNHSERKPLGEFYTSRPIVDYILSATEYNTNNSLEDKKLIDISCGSGSFLIQAVKRLLYFFKNLFNISEFNDLTIVNAKYIIQKIKENIYGVDINPVACILCQINIYFILFEIFRIIKKHDNNYRLPKFNILNINALNLKFRNKFDIVVGNPPYLFIREIPSNHRELIEKGDFETNKGQYDYYQIFIELGIKLLKNQGKFGYIVPDSLLALTNRSIIRKFIYYTTKIKEIYHTGPKFDDAIVSNIILILEKESESCIRDENIIKIKLSNQQEIQITQETLKQWDFKFLIHLNETDISIIEHLNKKFPKLKNLNKNEEIKINLSRGVELAKTGEIIFCKRCGAYFPVPKKALICSECKSHLKTEHIEKIIHQKIPENKNEDFKRFLYAINRYQIKNNKYIDISKNGINYKNLDIYEDRIIIRQLSQNSLICATYDKDLSLTSQSFYNLKILQSPIAEFNHLYLLGIINSKLLSYYFIKSFCSYKKLFSRILIEKIKSLPIKIPNTNEERNIALEIKLYVEKMLNFENEHLATIEQIQKEIDSRVFNLYRISNKDQEYISNFISNLNK
ncbi:MAG: Eco57I restriction-modification methylase domain-containing protein [Candidatus Hodarchaeota archaeon]